MDARRFPAWQDEEDRGLPEDAPEGLLLGCPHCGGAGRLVEEVTGAAAARCFIRCLGCGARGPAFAADLTATDRREAEARAAEAWNRRTEP